MDLMLVEQYHPLFVGVRNVHVPKCLWAEMFVFRNVHYQNVHFTPFNSIQLHSTHSTPFYSILLQSTQFYSIQLILIHSTPFYSFHSK